jgi:hypothetical protein
LSIYISKHSEIILAPLSKEIKAGYTLNKKIASEVINLNSSLEIIGEDVKETS